MHRVFLLRLFDRLAGCLFKDKISCKRAWRKYAQEEHGIRTCIVNCNICLLTAISSRQSGGVLLPPVGHEGTKSRKADHQTRSVVIRNEAFCEKAGCEFGNSRLFLKEQRPWTTWTQMAATWLNLVGDK